MNKGKGHWVEMAAELGLEKTRPLLRAFLGWKKCKYMVQNSLYARTMVIRKMVLTFKSNYKKRNIKSNWFLLSKSQNKIYFIFGQLINDSNVTVENILNVKSTLVALISMSMCLFIHKKIPPTCLFSPNKIWDFSTNMHFHPQMANKISNPHIYSEPHHYSGH